MREEVPLANNSELRRRLQEITDMAAEHGMFPDQLEQMIDELASTHAHSIRRLRKDEAKGYRCFVYAFELVDSPKYGWIAEADTAIGRNIFCAGSEFARFLIETGALVEIDEDEPRLGDVVIYLDDEGTPEHAGKIVSSDKQIKCKWGGTKLFMEHGLWEVPESYGNTVTFFRSICAGQAEQTFLEFVKSRDGGEEFIDDYHLRDLFECSENERKNVRRK